MLENYKKIHFIGIGGIGTSALARLMKKLGKEVTGSDLAESEITKVLSKQRAEVFIDHKMGNLKEGTDLVIYTEAISQDNPELKKAKKEKITTWGYPKALGEIMKAFQKSIAVSGTHGKSTVTSLIGLILEKAGLDPTVIVGSKVKKFDKNLRFGQSEYLVAEACEWKKHMLNLSPNIIVLTNIEEEHLDYYKDLDEIKKAFQNYIEKLPRDGYLVINDDDKTIKELKLPETKVISYSLKNNEADLYARNLKSKSEKQYFEMIWRGEELGEFSINIPGKFNIYNILASVSLALELGVELKAIKDVIENFEGIWRRFEILGEKKGALIVSDYAHHPTEIKATIQAAQDFYPERRIVAVFQPHQRDRTKKLFNRFIESFDGADLLILNEVYEVTGRELYKNKDISAKNLVKKIKGRGIEVIFTESLDDTKIKIEENRNKGDLILIMGAGDIYRVALDLID